MTHYEWVICDEVWVNHKSFVTHSWLIRDSLWTSHLRRRVSKLYLCCAWFITNDTTNQIATHSWLTPDSFVTRSWRVNKWVVLDVWLYVFIVCIHSLYVFRLYVFIYCRAWASQMPHWHVSWIHRDLIHLIHLIHLWWTKRDWFMTASWLTRDSFVTHSWLNRDVLVTKESSATHLGLTRDLFVTHSWLIRGVFVIYSHIERSDSFVAY